MISALRRSRNSPSDTCHDTDEYRKLPGTGSGAEGSIKLNNITRTTDIQVTNEEIKNGQQVATMKPVWDEGKLGIAI